MLADQDLEEMRQRHASDKEQMARAGGDTHWAVLALYFSNGDRDWLMEEVVRLRAQRDAVVRALGFAPGGGL